MTDFQVNESLKTMILMTILFYANLIVVKNQRHQIQVDFVFFLFLLLELNLYINLACLSVCLSVCIQ